jgi:hypothetical protein
VGTRSVCGYLRKGFVMRSTEIVALRQQILNCAAGRGMAVDAIYEEEADRVSDRLSECLGVVLKADEPVLIVPSLLHFSGLGNPLDVRRDFQGQGVRVLVAQEAPDIHSVRAT